MPEGGAEELYAEFVKSWEKVATAQMDQILKSPAFAASMGKTVAGALDFLGQIKKTVEASLSALNLPTKQEYEDLLARSQAVQERVERLHDKVDALLRKERGERKKPVRRQRAR